MSELYPIIDAYLEKGRFIRIDLILPVETFSVINIRTNKLSNTK